MSIGRYIRDALTAQFYNWEVRGRGWFLSDRRIALEPPFRPFEGHFVPQSLTEDDGRVESAGSRFARGMGRLLGIGASAPLPERPLELPEPEFEEGETPDGLVELQLALPPEFQPSANVFEQFLASIGYARSPVAFEVVGTNEELVVQVTASEDDAPNIEAQLRAFFPEAVIVSTTDHLSAVLSTDSDPVFEVADFGLEREFVVPIASLKSLPADPLVAICGALDSLDEGETGVLQVLLRPVSMPWAPSMIRAVSLGDGKPFFANDPDILGHTRLKVARPLYAAVLRVAAKAPDRFRAEEILRALAGGLRPLGSVTGNRLIALSNDGYDEELHLDDIRERTTHRSGMVLNSDEVIALAHLPTAAVRTKSLRRVLRHTKEAPEHLLRESGSRIGTNEHEGLRQSVWLPDALRLNHCHILGGTGSGKSTLLALLAVEDIRAGRGVAVIDPHGDLIDLLIPHIPKERRKDVILFDPTDAEYAIAFNPLAAGTGEERELLATDFIAVMKQHTSGWGDQMSSLLGNAVLAFLSSKKGGTLPELRRFLADPKFRATFLQTVENHEVVYFWEHEASLANKTAVGSILTRLDSLLRYESLLHILGQRENRLDFGDIMDSGKIFLGRLAKGLIGAENAYLLGSLLVSRFYQTTIARQARRKEDRRPYFLLMDEAGDLLTPTVSEILKGTRKYGLGLTLAHQSLAQLRRDEEVYGAVMGNCGIRVCFQVSGDDARKLAEEFGGFRSDDLLNQSPLNALVRVGPRDSAFNLETEFLPEAPNTGEDAHGAIQATTRARYGTLRESIRKELAALRGVIPPAPGTDPFSRLAAKRRKDAAGANETKDQGAPTEPTVPEAPMAESAAPPAPAEEKDERPNGEAIKGMIIRTAGGWGFSHETEKPVNGGTGRVDIVLYLGSLEIACEISATTNAEHEFSRNIGKCLAAGFERIFLICDVAPRRRRIVEMVETRCSVAERVRVECLSTHDFLARLQTLAEEARAALTNEEAAGAKSIPTTQSTATPEERRAAADDAWKRIAALKEQHRKKPPGG